MKLTEVYYEMPVDVSPQEAWAVINRYGDVGDINGVLKSSKAVNGSANEGSMGADRMCVIPNGKKDILVWEKIIDFKEGSHLTYDVYQWENFPLNKMHNTFGVKVKGGQTYIYQRSKYRLKPGFLSGIMKGKLRGGAREALTGFKHFLETGEARVDPKVLKKQYRAV